MVLNCVCAFPNIRESWHLWNNIIIAKVQWDENIGEIVLLIHLKKCDRISTKRWVHYIIAVVTWAQVIHLICVLGAQGLQVQQQPTYQTNYKCACYKNLGFEKLHTYIHTSLINHNHLQKFMYVFTSYVHMYIVAMYLLLSLILSTVGM